MFGRSAILNYLPELNKAEQVLDLGCGTGKHLLSLGRHYQDAQITGLDASDDMLNKAQSKIGPLSSVEIRKSELENFLPKPNFYDLIFCSYSLSMCGKNHLFLEDIYSSLKKNGILVVVDFDSTPFPFFERWMNFNHVQISGKLFEKLEKEYNVKLHRTKKVYFGLWKYSLFVGSK